MKALVQVEAVKLSRSLGVFLLSIGMPVIFFLIFSSTIQFDDATMQKAFIQSYMLTMTGFSMSGFALFTFPTMLAEDRKNSWLTFIQHSPLPIWQYYLSKLVRVLLCFVSSLAIVFAVGGLVKGVEMTAQEWVISALLLLVTSIVFLAIGLLLVQIQSEQTMSVVANLLYFVLAIMGGSWMPVSLFPDWVQRICKLMPSYHVNQLVTTYAQEGDFLWKSLLIVLGYAIIFLGIALVLNRKSEKQ
ncbi:ABC transporter permease [Streptococcus suis]|uniref:ABC transporter n=1 Tax=Streptococcus suis TaxID=1307 RepID=A0A116NM08_STRSU|nr:ABC transporter permease [Streptococcus suis]NQG45359.1 ABC transporter permease [Streptococcus suis]NQH73292.1 ABC transporter permease [Streptococcus suis]CYU28223.1 ABC transporter [Streptococcus suis]CYW10287.1 ABC transporter [Streptococcus suis]